MAAKAITPMDFGSLQMITWLSNQVPALEQQLGRQITSINLVMERDAKYVGGIGYGAEITYAEVVEQSAASDTTDTATTESSSSGDLPAPN